MRLDLFAGAALIAFMAAPVLSYAQQPEDIGKYEYRVSCAVCHGDNGKGDGSLMRYYNKHAADLTIIQKNNNGVFPFDRVYEVIDGRRALAAHGPSDMPVWGDVYNLRVQGYRYELLTASETESYVRGRIIALIGYISTLQAK